MPQAKPIKGQSARRAGNPVVVTLDEGHPPRPLGPSQPETMSDDRSPRPPGAADAPEQSGPINHIGLPALRSAAGPERHDQALRWKWSGLAAGLLLLAGAFVIWLQPWGGSTPVVAVEVLAPGPVTRLLAVNGRVAALNSVAVRSAVSGTLDAPLAEEGDRVAKGDVLARIDSSLQMAVLNQVEAALAAGRVAQQQAAATVDRTTAMGENVPRITLEDATRALATSGNDVRRLSALVDQARIQLDKFTVTAPIDGTILSRAVDPGQLVDTSMVLFDLADLSELVVEADVDETYAAQVTPGLPALLQLVGETATRPGHVSFVAPKVNADTGGLAVKVAFDEPAAVPVGLTVTANIIVEVQTAALTAPRSAILTDARNASTVFLLKDGKAVRTPVTVVDWPAARLLVKAGLAAGDSLIVTATGLTEGQAVSISDE